MLPGRRTAVARSRLAGIASPYLALHVDDPVQWWPWGPAALAEARRRNVPLLVSVGFFACHWCHVQHKESFRDPGIAALINDNFVPVKVDREIEGALDIALQRFAERHTGRRGWPLQVLVTPDGYPAAAGLYEPREAFRATLERWAGRWRADAAAWQREARSQAPPPQPPPARIEPTPKEAAMLRQSVRDEALRRADLLQGGFGAVAKFPSAPQLLALLAMQQHEPDARVDEFLRLTLTEMATLGLRDHLWGGFFRYTVDPGWREPHFEKMLSDNALLALVYLRAAAALRQPRWRAVAMDTLAFLRAELWLSPPGAYASGVSAQDAQGRDGARYLWEPKQLAALLPADEYAAVARVWKLHAAPVNPLGYLPLQATAPEPPQQALLERAYRRLREQRKGATHPRDDKLLAGLNGLALAALAEAAAHDRRAQSDAAAIGRFLAGAMWDGRSLRRLAGSAVAGELEDYAFVAWGLSRWAAFARSDKDRALGVAVARAGWDRFHRDGGWFREEQPLLAGLGPEAAIADTYVPSPSATLILASVELGEPALVARAVDAIAVGLRPPAGAAFGWATQSLALDRVLRTPTRRP